MTSAPAPEARNGHHVKNTTSLGSPSRQQKYRQPPAPHLHAVHQLPELDALPRHDDLDVLEQVPEVTRRQRRTRHAQLTQAREDSGELTEGRVGHHTLAEVVLEEVDVLVDDIEPKLSQVVTRRAVTVEGFPEGEVAWDVGAHVLPRGEGGHVVVVFYHRKFRLDKVRCKQRVMLSLSRQVSQHYRCRYKEDALSTAP